MYDQINVRNRPRDQNKREKLFFTKHENSQNAHDSHWQP